MKYRVTVGDRAFQVEVVGARTLLDGREVRARLGSLPGTPERQLELDGALATFAMTRGDGLWEVVRGGEVLEARVVDERTWVLEGIAAQRGAAAGVHVVKAPMPGLVIRVEVTAGEVVHAGQGLVVLEAMKMENELASPAAGTVRSVHAAAGQPVEKGMVLVEVVTEG